MTSSIPEKPSLPSWSDFISISPPRPLMCWLLPRESGFNHPCFKGLVSSNIPCLCSRKQRKDSELAVAYLRRSDTPTHSPAKSTTVPSCNDLILCAKHEEASELSRLEHWGGSELCVPSQIPHARPVEEARDAAVFADLEDGAEVAGDEGGGGAVAFGEGGGRAEIGAGEGVHIVAQNRAEGEQPAVGIGDEGAVQTGQGLEHGGVELGHRTTTGQVMDRPLGQGLDERRDRDVTGVTRSSLAGGSLLLCQAEERKRSRRRFSIDRVCKGGGSRLGVELELEHIVRSNQPADCPRGVGDDNKQASLTLLGKVERRLKEHAGQTGIGDRPFPERKLGLRVEHPPAAVGEDKRLHSTGEHLDLLVRAEHEADMAACP